MDDISYIRFVNPHTESNRCDNYLNVISNKLFLVFAANLILKPLVGGKRPDPQTLSSARRLKGQPLSGAFPSGHSASAAAFATGASLSWPVLTPVLAPLAGLVGYSRIHTGAH